MQHNTDTEQNDNKPLLLGKKVCLVEQQHVALGLANLQHVAIKISTPEQQRISGIHDLHNNITKNKK